MKRCALMTLIALLGACGGSDRVDGPPVDVTFREACAQYAKAYCEVDAKCAPASFAFYWHDDATCRSRAELSCMSRSSATGTSDTPARVGECAKEVLGLSCDGYVDIDHWPKSCELVPGRIADGAPCMTSGQCQGRFCMIGDNQACGVCGTVASEGGTCKTEFDCLNAMPCVGGICTARPAFGDPCSMRDALPCGASLFCRPRSPVDGTCERRVGVGVGCGARSPENAQCLENLECNAQSSLCVARPPIPTVGEPCASGGQCDNTARCSGAFVCEARPREGDACLAGSVECLIPARCIDGTCKIRDAAMCM